jgi:FtsH-binding integral membrane protein
MDDYIIGALALYIDIIGLFLNILELLNRLQRD